METTPATVLLSQGEIEGLRVSPRPYRPNQKAGAEEAAESIDVRLPSEVGFLPDRYVSPASIRNALFLLNGTADSIPKVWIALKQMGLTPEATVDIPTTNSAAALDRLFDCRGTEETRKYLVPVSAKQSDLTMHAHAPRSIMETNISKARSGGVKYYPKSYLRSEGLSVSGHFRVATQPGYPQRLGFGKNGPAKGDGKRVALPWRGWSVWYGIKASGVTLDGTSRVTGDLLLRVKATCRWANSIAAPSPAPPTSDHP